MTHAERKALREKHMPCTTPGTDKPVCNWCDDGCGILKFYPCDVIKVLDYLDVVEPMPRDINWKGGK
jgi:hypothetical protein